MEFFLKKEKKEKLFPAPSSNNSLAVIFFPAAHTILIKINTTLNKKHDN